MCLSKTFHLQINRNSVAGSGNEENKQELPANFIQSNGPDDKDDYSRHEIMKHAYSHTLSTNMSGEYFR